MLHVACVLRVLIQRAAARAFPVILQEAVCEAALGEELTLLLSSRDPERATTPCVEARRVTSACLKGCVFWP